MSAVRKEILRFTSAQRIEHIVLIVSFTTLALTGLPQKYPLSPVSQIFVQMLGGIEVVRIIHRIAATLFLLEAIYHAVVVGYKLFVRGLGATMIPSIKDGKDAIQAFLYKIGRSKQHPKMGRYNFTEKAEYWAMLWGLLVMAITGFMLWNPIATTRVLPGEWIPAAKIAHGGEAVLAVLAIILWHFYHVHIRRFNKSMFTGNLDREAMHEEHGEELEQIEKGTLPRPAPPAVAKRRMAIFAPVATVFSIALLAGVYWFVSFEESAITTIPPAQAGSAFTQPTPTAQAVSPTQPAEEGNEAAQPGGAVTEAAAWSAGIGDLFQQRCTSCHGEEAAAGDFSTATYDTVLAGIEPGNSSDSRVVQVQSRQQHPGNFTPTELNEVRAWINQGAPQDPGDAVALPGGGDETWVSGIQEMSQAKCGTCHGASAAGGFTVEEYDSMMEFVTPGDAEGSRVVEVQREGHPAVFTDAELNRLIQWINAGAPEQ